MRFWGWRVLLVLPVLFLVAIRAAAPGDEQDRPKPPPLSLEGLLDEKLPEAPKKKTELNVDNSACYVCHENYREEGLVVEHGLEEIGCVDCHGESTEHRNDEDNITPPEVMYALDTVDEKCSECHDEHDAPAVEVLQRWQTRCPEKTSPEEIVCTDCHFQHRLARRQVSWNKKTGELIIRKVDEK